MKSSFSPRLIGLLIFFLLVPAVSALAASFIVELNEEPVAVAAAKARAAGAPMSAEQIETRRAALASAQDQLLGKLRAAGVPFEVGGATVAGVRVAFRYTLVFNGINLIADPASVAAIEAMPEVKKVHPDRILWTTLDRSVPYIRAPQVYGAVPEVTQFDDVREGLEGQGIYVSIIDTGVEWQHEMFGGDLTPPRLGVEPPTSGRNAKVVYNLPLGDAVVEDTVGHGTHVAATAAGYRGFAPGPDGLPLTADDIPMHGVAPQARIMAYKVCSDTLSNVGLLTGAIGGCFESVIAMGIEDSVSPRTVNGFAKPVAHVINMSLGGSGTPNSVTAVAADNAVLLGTSVIAAGGNSGPGPATVGAPCVGRRVTCVANSIDPSASWSFDVLDPSSVNRLLPGAISPASSLPLASGPASGVQLHPLSGTPPPPAGSVAQYYVYVLGGETPDSYPPSVAGRIAIVRTTLTATFAQIVNSAATAGAVAVIQRTNTSGGTAVKGTIPGATLPVADFDALVALMGAGSAPPSGTLSKHPIRLNSYFPNATMNTSSSRGPVAGFGQVKPDVSAPGTNINAAVPYPSLLGALEQSNYASISGTSMASPHVAGAAALVKQAHPAWSPDMIRTALQNTSTHLRDQAGTAKADGTTAESVMDQGSGLIDVEGAVNAKALMGVAGDGISAPSILGSHSFGVVPAIDSRGIVTRRVPVEIRDLSGEGGTYNLAVVDNRGLAIPGISVSVPSTVSVAPAGTASFEVSASVDGNVVTSGDPLEVQWYVRASRSDGGETLVMPFYLRATRSIPPAPVMLPIGDDESPDQEGGVDRDGRFVLSWSWPSESTSVPCGFRLEETQPVAAGLMYHDDAEELMLSGGNSRWASVNWTSKPHPGTATLGYGAIYVDESTASLTSAIDIHLPPALVTLSFESFEDIELDFDYGFVDASADGGATWTTLAQYTGFFAGQRTVDLTPLAGNAIRIRFRLVSDQLISTPAHQGWTIDDIRIHAGSSFSTFAQVDGSARSYQVTGKEDGLWAYRVTALFGDCSTPFAGAPSNIEQIEVRNAAFPPVAAFNAGPNPSDTGEGVTFDASASHDRDDLGGSPGIVQYLWSFGDGATASTTSSSIDHAYASAGTYRVVLTVEDGEGESASAEALQTVSDPSATISGGGKIATAGGHTNFAVDVTQAAGLIDGSVTWHDHGSGMRVVSTRITSVERSGKTATIRGDCTINKRQTATFVLELSDNGSDGDFGAMSSGSYSGSGSVTSGGITVEE
ncbi:MAG TPA: S8 family serine peptidase [Thermoanaerobaculia bacterium]|nr:S8 family serine peptidase [Thermoanaerobaculia bacterium]